MSDGIDQLRADLARERGLPDGAATFLEGGTVAEVEAQADKLAALLGTTRAPEPEEPEPAPNPFAIAIAQKQQRKAELVAMFTGRAPRRDGRGRFVKGGYDGGARASLPEPPDPVRDHDELVTEMARARRIFGGSDY